jgi:tetratricopeptide (TPR) repeat protein
MVRCPRCHRRLVPAGCCPRDGTPAPAAPVTTPPAAPPQPPPGLRVGSLLGSGGFASVWEARAEGDGAVVALKVSHAADTDAHARLLREQRLLAHVGPPGVPRVIGCGRLGDGRAYLVTERLRGPCLADVMAGWPEPPSAAQLLRVGGALLSAAAALHARGVVHRDLKPDNVFLDPAPGEAATLIDLGLASLLAGDADGEAASDAGAGTPLYMSPEQISGRPGGAAADVYALGVTLFELACLRPPFVGDRRELEYAHLSFRPPRPGRYAPVPAAFEELVLRCLSKDPGDRPADAGVLREAFVQAMAGAATPAAAGGATTPAGDGGGVTHPRAALLFMQGEALDPLEVQAAMKRFGGQLVHLAAGRCACAFTHQAGEQPGRRAQAAANGVLAAGLARAVILDVGTLVARQRPGGPARLSSPAFSDPGRFPSAADPAGLRITPAAREAALGDRAADGPLFGRQDLVRALIAEVGRAVGERRPRVARVLAEPGLGKTHLAAALAERLRAELPGATVLALAAREPAGEATDGPLADLLRRALDAEAPGPETSGRARLAQLLGDGAREAAVAAALELGWLSPDDPAVRSLRAAPGALRAGSARAGVAALGRLAARAPVLVLLDDAHWADDALLDALEQATVAQLPLWVCALGRPAFAGSRPDWGQRAGHLHEVSLGPLDDAGAAALCRHLLAPAEVHDSVVARLVQRTRGLPWLACELVRCLRREGLVRQTPAGVWFVAGEVLDQVSDSPQLAWLAGRLLDGLPPELAAHARLLALLAHELSVDEVEGVLAALPAELADLFPLDGRVGIERLQQAGLMAEPRLARFAYVNDVMREAVAATVSPALAARIHPAALGYYRAAALPRLVRLARVAWHASAAGERREAAAAYGELAEAARERHSYLEAEALYTRSLGQLAPDQAEARLRSHKGRGIMRYRLARYDDSLADLAEAHQLALGRDDPRVVVDVMLDESMALDWVLEWQRSRELAERAQRLVGDDPDPVLRARVLLAVGRSFHRFNQDREAATPLREAVRLAEAAGDDGYEVAVAANLMLGFLLPFLGLLDEAEERLRRVELRCQDKGDEAHLMAMWNNRSCLWIARDDRARFTEDNDRVMDWARRNGNPYLERNGCLNRAYYLYWRGEHREAMPFAQRTMAIDQRYFRQGGFRPDGAVLLARIRWCLGEDARDLLEDVRRHQAQARAEHQPEQLLQPNDELLLDMVALLVEGGDAAQWAALVARAEQVAQGQELVEVLELAGSAALGRQDGAAARGHWQQALAVCRRIPCVMEARIRARLAQMNHE